MPADVGCGLDDHDILRLRKGKEKAPRQDQLGGAAIDCGGFLTGHARSLNVGGKLEFVDPKPHFLYILHLGQAVADRFSEVLGLGLVPQL